MSESTQQNRLVAFDVCDTLYDVNTTVEFIDYYQDRQNNRRIGRTVRRWRNRTSPFFYLGAAVHRLRRLDIARQRIIASLAGESREELAAAARDYVRDLLGARANHVLHERLESHQAAGDRVLLVSSSLDLVVAEIAAILGVEYRASELGFERGVCIGRLLRDLTGSKAAVVSELLEPNSDLWVYTDNRSDRDLLELADRPIIVIPRGRGTERWGGADCEYISL